MGAAFQPRFEEPNEQKFSRLESRSHKLESDWFSKALFMPISGRVLSESSFRA